MIRTALLLIPLLLSAADIAVTEAWSRATASGAAAGALFCTITNTGAADRLVKAESAAAATVELHTHAKGEDGLMRMRPVDAIDIPSNAALVLEPGSFHVMLIGLKAPLAEGTQVQATLHFAKAGAIPVTATVLSAGAMGPAAGGCATCAGCGM